MTPAYLAHLRALLAEWQRRSTEDREWPKSDDPDVVSPHYFPAMRAREAVVSAVLPALPALLDTAERHARLREHVTGFVRSIDENPNEECPLCDVVDHPDGGVDHDEDCPVELLRAALDEETKR